MYLKKNVIITFLICKATFFLSAASFLSAAISAGLFAEFFASDIANFAAFFSSTAAMLAAILASDIANLAAFFSSAAAMSEAISSKVRLSYKIY